MNDHNEHAVKWRVTYFLLTWKHIHTRSHKICTIRHFVVSNTLYRIFGREYSRLFSIWWRIYRYMVYKYRKGFSLHPFHSNANKITDLFKYIYTCLTINKVISSIYGAHWNFFCLKKRHDMRTITPLKPISDKRIFTWIDIFPPNVHTGLRSKFPWYLMEPSRKRTFRFTIRIPRIRFLWHFLQYLILITFPVCNESTFMICRYFSM